jgi:hypothetical protein
MHAKLAFVCLSIIAADAMAVDANNPSSSATPSAQTAAIGKTVVPRRFVAPTISETRATRMPDGSLALSCKNRPNPKARALSQQTRDPRIDPNQQP